MYLIECANAYLAAVQLQQKEMDYQTAFAVMMVKKQLQSHVEFLQNEELKLAEKYAEKDEKGNIKWTERGTFPYRVEDAAAGRAPMMCRPPLMYPPPSIRSSPARPEGTQGAGHDAGGG